MRAHLTLKVQSDLLRELVFVDGLTGVYNRRHFDERLAREFQRARRQGSSLALMMIDVDYFKRFNDRYGHLAGDDGLRRVAATLKAQLKRPADLLSRFGGEEFACVLPDTELPGALALADEMGAAVQALGIAHADSDVAPCLTISIGVAALRPHGTLGPSELVVAADEQLYLAKSGGRRRASGITL